MNRLNVLSDSVIFLDVFKLDTLSLTYIRTLDLKYLDVSNGMEILLKVPLLSAHLSAHTPFSIKDNEAFN